MEINNFIPNIRIGEPKLSAGKEHQPNYSGEANYPKEKFPWVIDNESHDNNNHGIFCVTGKDSDYIDTDDLY